MINYALLEKWYRNLKTLLNIGLADKQTFLWKKEILCKLEFAPLQTTICMTNVMTLAQRKQHEGRNKVE